MLFYLSPPCKNKRPHLFNEMTPLRIFAYELRGGSLAVYCRAGLREPGPKPEPAAQAAVLAGLWVRLVLALSCCCAASQPHEPQRSGELYGQRCITASPLAAPSAVLRALS